ncbi:MAG: hypothetical protein CL735_05425 [Chloroflexi bacterium]|nr:hypothetical protein [Chloroflexota bacterium]
MTTPISNPSEILEFNEYIDVINHFIDSGWTDGLPIIPPTQELVDNFINISGRSASEILGSEPTRGRIITVEKAAINSVMAGCLPEYFPVIIAACEAMCEPEFNLHGITASTMGAAPLILVNGPISSKLKINSGFGLFGPGHRANATIGRAIRLIIINATGAVPGILDKATLGHAGKYTWCISESESISNWDPLQVERGFDKSQSTVTLFAGLSPIQIQNHESNSPQGIVQSFKDAMFTSGSGQEEIIVILPGQHMGHITKSNWSKTKLQQCFYDSTIKQNDIEWNKAYAMRDYIPDPESPKSVTRSPEGITIVPAGGEAGGFAQLIPLWGGGSSSQSVTKEILLN